MTRFPRIVPDRDRWRRWYLDEDVHFFLPDGHTIIIHKGYRFNGHSTGIFRFIFPRYDKRDIQAALIHDALIDTMPWHRFDRRYIDEVYDLMMQNLSYGRRKYWMPKAVYLWGWVKTLGYRDYRGEVKPGTVIDVKVSMV